MPMRPLDLEVLTVIKAIEAAGGRTSIAPDAPDYIKMAFLEMLMDCPDCRLAVMGKHDGCAN
jgi:hypothetical protein